MFKIISLRNPEELAGAVQTGALVLYGAKEVFHAFRDSYAFELYDMRERHGKTVILGKKGELLLVESALPWPLDADGTPCRVIVSDQYPEGENDD